MNDEQITIPRKEYDELTEAHAMLQALEAAGVDSWDGFEDAQEMIKRRKTR